VCEPRLYDLFVLVRAIETRDIDTVTRHVYFDAVRNSLTDQIVAAYVRRTGGQISPLARSMAASALGIADPVVKKLISPEALFRAVSENDFVLVVAWLLGALRAGGPYPVLAIAGEQGSAKTVLSKLLRAVIDPSVAPVRALPRDERELFIAAGNGHVLAFDNLSGLPPWLSDTLCRLTSGGAFSTRRLFTDQDEILFVAARPVILNGIEDIISRPDLADRAILLMLAPIPESKRRPEHALWREPATPSAPSAASSVM
jgi:Protein of unknown function (DUF2939)